MIENRDSSEILGEPSEITLLYDQFINKLRACGGLSQLGRQELHHQKENRHKNIFPLGKDIYILQKGNVALLRQNRNRHQGSTDMPEKIAIHSIQTPGQIINPIARIEDFSEIACQDDLLPTYTTTLLTIPRDIGLKLFIEDESFRSLAFCSMEQSINSLGQQLELRLHRDYLQKLLAGFLLTNQTNGHVFATQVELASLFGTDRPTISRIIRELRANGALANGQGKGIISITDMHYLESLIAD